MDKKELLKNIRLCDYCEVNGINVWEKLTLQKCIVCWKHCCKDCLNLSQVSELWGQIPKWICKHCIDVVKEAHYRNSWFDGGDVFRWLKRTDRRFSWTTSYIHIWDIMYNIYLEREKKIDDEKIKTFKTLHERSVKYLKEYYKQKEMWKNTSRK